VARTSAARTLSFAAETRLARLGTDAQGESTLFRLIEQGGTANPLDLPVIRTKQGEDLAFAITNRLAQPIAFHARGARQPHANDGMPRLGGETIAAGATAILGFSARQAGTFLLSPVMLPHVPEQVSRGLQAIVVVEEPNPPRVDHDVAFAVGDFRLGDDGVLAGDFNAKAEGARVGRLGNRLTANGRPAPGRMTVRSGARVRLRLVNVSNARMIQIRVTNLVARVVAIDSTPCQPFDPLKRTVVVAPASRIDMIIDCPAEAGIEGVVEARLGNGLPLYVFKTEGTPLPPAGDITPLPDPGLPPAIRLQDAMRADIAISGGAPRDLAVEDRAGLDRLLPDGRPLYRINGQPGGIGEKPLIRVRRGQVLVLALRNTTAWPQVIAVHGHSFRLLHPFDDGWEPYFLDTMYLVPNSIARIALIADNPGRWAIRSTIAEHFAAGVATWFEVT
jgi:FtsP/CotA-like multicopper oxidase with cupredoxin domain